MKSTFTETETTAENEQVVAVDRTQGDLAVESLDRLQHVSDVRRRKTV